MRQTGANDLLQGFAALSPSLRPPPLRLGIACPRYSLSEVVVRCIFSYLIAPLVYEGMQGFGTLVSKSRVTRVFVGPVSICRTKGGCLALFVSKS